MVMTMSDQPITIFLQQYERDIEYGRSPSVMPWLHANCAGAYRPTSNFTGICFDYSNWRIEFDNADDAMLFKIAYAQWLCDDPDDLLANLVFYDGDDDDDE
jgi:hypothetical protein